MGTPTEETWPGVSKLPKYKNLLGNSAHRRHHRHHHSHQHRHHQHQHHHGHHHHQQSRSQQPHQRLSTGACGGRSGRGGCGLLWHTGKPLNHVVPRLGHIAHATALASALLQLPPERRITARAALRHPYFTVSLPTAQLACLPDSKASPPSPSLKYCHIIVTALLCSNALLVWGWDAWVISYFSLKRFTSSNEVSSCRLNSPFQNLKMGLLISLHKSSSACIRTRPIFTRGICFNQRSWSKLTRWSNKLSYSSL